MQLGKLMKILSKTIILTLILLTSYIYSQDTLKWSFKYSGYVDLKTIKLPSGGQIINLFNNGTWEDSLGNYGKGYCYGIVESNKNKDDFFQYYCELSDQDSDKIFTKGSRKSEDAKAGVGKQKIIDGTGKWKKLIGATCIYGVKYVDEVLFASQKCKFPGE